MQIEELAARMGHVANFGDAQLEAGLIASKVVTGQLGVLGAQEVMRIFACTARAEVVDYGLEYRERRAAISPDVSTVGFLLS